MSCGRPDDAPAPLRVVRGASWMFRFTVWDWRRRPVPLAGAMAWFTVKHRLEDAAPVISKRSALAGGVDNQILLGPQTSPVVLLDNQFLVRGYPADTGLLDPGEVYVCDAFVQLPGGPPAGPYQVARNRGFVIDPAVTTTF